MKGFKTFEEQIDILKSRGLIIPDKEQTISILSRENYYNIINGYKFPFIDKKNSSEKYIENCSFDEIYALYQFDRHIRSISFKYILQIENILRTQISYVFSKYHDSSNYLCYENFETLSNVGDNKPLANRAKKIFSLFKQIQGDISKSIEYKDYIQHYILHYGYVPMWVLVNAIPLNRLSTFYRLMKQSERIEVSKHWDIREKDLRQYVSLLADFRNLCAHDERIYCYRSKLIIPDTDIHKALNIEKGTNGNYIQGKNDFFSLMIVLKYLLEPSDFNTFFNKVNGRLISLDKSLSSINIEVIKESMGFPYNWSEIKKS